MDRLPPASRPPLEPLGLDHVVLRVSDQARSQRFYTELLGLTLDHVNEAARLIQLRCGQSLIDLLPLAEGDTTTRVPTGPTEQPVHGMDHLCLSIRCADLPALARFLEEQGVPLEGPIVARRGAFGQGPSLYIRDPDGYRIELKPR